MSKQNVQESKISTDCTSPSNSPRLSRSHKTTVPKCDSTAVSTSASFGSSNLLWTVARKSSLEGKLQTFPKQTGWTNRTNSWTDGLWVSTSEDHQEPAGGNKWRTFLVCVCDLGHVRCKVVSNILFKILKPQTPPLPVWLFGYRPWAS